MATPFQERSPRQTRVIAKRLKGCRGKRVLLGLEFLEAHDVRFGFGKPGQKILQPLVDVVDVEGRDLHY